MRIITLKLSNFQGIKEKEIRFDGKNASIYGDNATGKTTVYNAFTWLMSGNASTGVKGYTPKTTDTHALDHSVEVEMVNSDGEMVSLKRVFHEVYKKRRGTTEQEFTGHETLYFVNDVPTKEKDYNEQISVLFGTPEQVKVLTMLDYFSEVMPWKDRRVELLNLCGDITDDDVISSNSELSSLNAILGGHSVDDMRAILTATRARLNKEIESIPTRIDEASKAMPDAPEGTRESLESQICALEKEIEELNIKKSDLTTNYDGRAEYLKQINDKNAEIQSAKAKYLEKASAEQEDYSHACKKLKDKVSAAESELNLLVTKESKAEAEINTHKTERERLANEWNLANEAKWDDSESVCPTCHRPLPEDDVAKLKYNFYIKKSDKLEKITAEGQKHNLDLINGLEDELAKLKATISEMQEKYTALLDELKAYETDHKPKNLPFESTALYKNLKEDLSNIKEPDGNNEDALHEIEEAINVKKSLKKSAEENIALYSGIESQKKRIKELNAEQKKLAKEYEITEQNLYLCDLFIKTKVSMLDEKINSKFNNVRFRLFQTQVNGGIKDDCEVLIPCDGKLVPYGYANNAARINAGLEIIHTFSEAWSISIPLFVDNAESVTALGTYPDMQIIRLVVSEEDKQLRTEIND